jgi:hypothetical protein
MATIALPRRLKLGNSRLQHSVGLQCEVLRAPCAVLLSLLMLVRVVNLHSLGWLSHSCMDHLHLCQIVTVAIAKSTSNRVIPRASSKLAPSHSRDRRRRTRDIN